jgi:multidrug efflux pump subunit AcrA (membrane-fusion protein)
MTQVGKILVLAIVGFSLVFLGISTTVFMTSKNWKDETAKKTAEVKKIQKSLSESKAQVDAAQKELADAQSQAAAATQQLNDRIKLLDDQNKRDQIDIQDVRGKLVTAQENAKSALDEAAHRRDETLLLRTQKSAVEKQANEFKLRQADLTDRIRELERMMETATRNNSDLLERNTKFTTLLQKNGLSTDISQIKGLESPPPVEGLIKRVDATNRRVEISIGSDDGLVAGHELNLYRIKPRPEFLGKILIVAVDPNQAVGRVVGNTYQGKKIKEGDIVSSTINPRF